MVMTSKRIRKRIGRLVLAGLVMLTAACGDQPETGAPRPGTPEAGSFTFFDIGKDTRMTGQVRGDLEKILGDVAVERRGIINLTLNYNTFLEEHFPGLDRMNRALNSDIGLRVKHPVTRLMYRYGRLKGLPYDLVEFIFAEKSKRPILIRLHFRADNPETLKTLEEKYGPPRTFAWGKENASSLVWEKEGDYLFYSVIPRRGGKVEYRIAIYYTAAIEDLIESEKTERETQTSRSSGF